LPFQSITDLKNAVGEAVCSNTASWNPLPPLVRT
jgi:hypothetical protein